MRLLQQTIKVKAGDWAFWQMLERKEAWHRKRKHKRVLQMLGQIRETAVRYAKRGVPLSVKNELRYIDDGFRYDPGLLKPGGERGRVERERPVERNRHPKKNTRRKIRHSEKLQPQGLPNDRLIHLRDELLGAWGRWKSDSVGMPPSRKNGII